MKSILKQTSWLFFAQVITRIIGFFYTIFLAKNLGVSDFGLFSLGLAYFSIISSFSDFGFNRFLVREVAKDGSKLWELLWNVLMLRITLISIFFAIFSAIYYFFDQDKERVSIILLSTLAVLPQSMALTFDGIFIALQKLQFSAISAFLASLSTVFLGLILVIKGFGPIGAVNALIIGQFVYVLVLIYFLYRKQGFKLTLVSAKLFKRAIFGSLPYGLLAILGLLYFRIDTLMLSYLRGNFETGIYAAGYRFLEGVVFIPTAMGIALFPAFAKLHKNPRTIKDLYYKSLKIMTLISLVVVFTYLTILPPIIKIFLSEYLQALEVIKILALAIPFMFLHIPASSVVLSTDRYLGKIILLSLIPLSFNVLMNLNFIPRYGFIAASWITVASDMLSFFLIFLFIRIYILKNA